MNLFRTVCAIAVLLVLDATATAATFRTSPFLGTLGSGIARCVLTNGGTTAGSGSVAIYNQTGSPLDTEADTHLPARSSTVTTGINLLENAPFFCECVVPSASTWRCSFVHVDTTGVVVIEGR